MDKDIVVLGYGATGRAATQALVAAGKPVRVAQRRQPADLPAAVAFRPYDAFEPASVSQAIAGADQVVLAIGFPYDSRLWREAWPKTMTNVIEACARSGARLVFVDNLYQLGPQTEPRTEDMPLSTRGRKPAILTQVARIWQAATDRVRVASLRAPDFYGPGVSNSHLGATAFGRLASGQRALLLAPPDTPHDFAYVPDMGRAVAILLDAPDEAYGQIWNMPCAPIRTPREILRLGASALGVAPRITAIPLKALPLLGLASTMMREVADVSFTWDRPYHVDARKFTRRFAFTPTPFEIGAPATARSFAVGT